MTLGNKKPDIEVVRGHRNGHRILGAKTHEPHDAQATHWGSCWGDPAVTDDTQKNRDARARDRRAYQLFVEAIELAPEARTPYLREQCGTDELLLKQVTTLLQSHDETSETNQADTSKAQPNPMIGKEVGRYTIRKVLGEGGMGVVYEAIQKSPRRTVALKMIRRNVTSRSALRRFEYEAQTLGRLQHEGIAHIFEADTLDEGHGPQPWFAMEYIVGAKTLTEYCSDKKLGTRKRLELFKQICKAVQHGHSKGIIHRDLKPSNILVTANGVTKIIDFGVARSIDSDLVVTTLQTDIGALIGTLQYMSPEQCEGDSNAIDTRSDVYALGVILYELLCNKLPYDVRKKAIHEVARMIREEAPTRPSTYDKQLRGDLEVIAMKALEKDRERRYQSTLDFENDISRYLAGDTILAKRASSLTLMTRFAKRHKATAAALVATFFVTILAAALSISFYIWGVEAQSQAQDEIARANAAKARANAAIAISNSTSQVAEAKLDIAQAELAKVQMLSREAERSLRSAQRQEAESKRQLREVRIAKVESDYIAEIEDARNALINGDVRIGDISAKIEKARRFHDYLRESRTSKPVTTAIAEQWEYPRVREKMLASVDTLNAKYESLFYPVSTNDAFEQTTLSSDDYPLELKLLNAKIDESTNEWPLPGKGGETIRACPDGVHVVIGSRDGTIILFDKRNGNSIDLSIRLAAGESQANPGIPRLAFSKNGTRLLAVQRVTLDQSGASKDKAVVFDVPNGNVVFETETTYGKFFKASTLSPDGTRLATIKTGRQIMTVRDGDLTCRVWDIELGNVTDQFILYYPVHQAWFGPNSNDDVYTLSPSQIARVKILEQSKGLINTSTPYEPRYPEETWNIDTAGLPFSWGVTVSGDGNHVCSFSRGSGFSGTLKAHVYSKVVREDGATGWNLRTIETGERSDVRGTLPGAIVTNACLNTDGSRLAVPTPSGIAIWDTHTLAQESRLNAATVALDFNPDGASLTGLYGARMMEFECIDRSTDTLSGYGFALEQAKKKSQLSDFLDGSEFSRRPLSLAFSFDGSIVAVDEGNGAIGLWDSIQGTYLATLCPEDRDQEDPPSITHLAFDATGTILASTEMNLRYDSQVLRIWDVRTGKEKHTLPLLTIQGLVKSVAFNQEEELIILVQGDEVLHVDHSSDTPFLNSVHQLQAESTSNLSAGGTRLAVVRDGAIDIINPLTTEIIDHIPTPPDYVATKNYGGRSPAVSESPALAMGPSGIGLAWVPAEIRDPKEKFSVWNDTQKTWNSVSVSSNLAPSVMGYGRLLTSPDGTRVIASDPDREVINIVDTSTGNILDTIKTEPGQYFSAIAIDTSGTRIAMSHGHGVVLFLDTMQRSARHANETRVRNRTKQLEEHFLAEIFSDPNASDQDICEMLAEKCQDSSQDETMMMQKIVLKNLAQRRKLNWLRKTVADFNFDFDLKIIFDDQIYSRLNRWRFPYFNETKVEKALLMLMDDELSPYQLHTKARIASETEDWCEALIYQADALARVEESTHSEDTITTMQARLALYQSLCDIDLNVPMDQRPDGADTMKEYETVSPN